MKREPTPTFVETVVQPRISQLTSSSSADEGRFLPGALLGGRYRILGLLGRGGMGEVYRATDLALGQAVALKFLPEEASRNPRLLERFHGEVRVARLVSHPNVCRVFDIGEVDGTPFISMEYVDGEDLGSLLTRIGRLPGDKALQAARQLCAGLAAAHDRGVIHRDLKPQNIMMNKRGDLVIMDFGLAAIADQLSGAEVRNGTPAYMAPEQLRGSGVTQASDIYALGLVLYELFTGKRPYEAKTLQHLIDLQESAHLTSMTSVATDVDPAVEKVIRRCLDPDPAKRPATALAASAALPGGDPLAAALAAGETPSPEMVASAGKAEGLPRKYSIPCLVLIAATLFAAPVFYSRIRAFMLAPLEKSADVLAHDARQIALSFGYTERPADSTLWFEHRSDIVQRLRNLPGPKLWESWFAYEAPFRAVYREAQAPLVANPAGRVELDNPPMSVPGMVTVALDGHGRLIRFLAVPKKEDATAPVPPETVFRAVRLDYGRFREAPATLAPAHAADTIRAWKGPHPVMPDTEMTIDVASWRGKITEVRMLYPWQTQASAATPPRPAALVRFREILILVLPIVGAVFAALVARRNWKQGRVDRRGALRLALARFFLGLVAWLCTMHPVPTKDMIGLFQNAAADLLAASVLLWLIYLAIEPAVRARYPHTMVTWNRLLGGRWLDAQVAADVLIGAALGCGLWVGAHLLEMGRDNVSVGGNLSAMLDTRHWIGRHAISAASSLNVGLVIFAVICFLRRLVRYDALAALATAVVFTLTEYEAVYGGWAGLALFIVVYGVLAFLLMRLGLVASLSAIVFINAFSTVWLGSDWKAWYAPAGIATILLMLSIAMIAFWKSLGSRDLLEADPRP
jgi:serine/threonine-protein kinase